VVAPGLRAELATPDTDDREAIGKPSGLHEIVERRYDQAPGQIAARAEDHERCRRRLLEVRRGRGLGYGWRNAGHRAHPSDPARVASAADGSCPIAKLSALRGHSASAAIAAKAWRRLAHGWHKLGN